MARELTESLYGKIAEQIERTEHLIGLIPPDKLSYSPECAGEPDRYTGALAIGSLLGHLLDCLGGFCAALYKANPDRLHHFSVLRGLPVNHFCEVLEARERIEEYALHIKEGFDLLSDLDLARVLPTAFVSSGEPLLTILLGNLEHLINHKFQLFIYLRLLGVHASSADLYRFRSI
jgi:hypothetical protein